MIIAQVDCLYKGSLIKSSVVYLYRGSDHRSDDSGGGRREGRADTDGRVPGDRGDNL